MWKQTNPDIFWNGVFSRRKSVFSRRKSVFFLEHFLTKKITTNMFVKKGCEIVLPNACIRPWCTLLLSQTSTLDDFLASSSQSQKRIDRHSMILVGITCHFWDVTLFVIKYSCTFFVRAFGFNVPLTFCRKCLVGKSFVVLFGLQRL